MKAIENKDVEVNMTRAPDKSETLSAARRKAREQRTADDARDDETISMMERMRKSLPFCFSARRTARPRPCRGT